MTRRVRQILFAIWAFLILLFLAHYCLGVIEKHEHDIYTAFKSGFMKGKGLDEIPKDVVY